METGPLRQRLFVDSEETGLKDLTDDLDRLVDWREDLQRLLVHRDSEFQGVWLHEHLVGTVSD